MSVEDVANGVDNIISRWHNKQENPTSAIGEDEALEMGILQPEEAEDNTSQINEEYTDTAPGEKEYEKLGTWDTTKDIAKSVGVEALHFVQPKDRETQYESRTHFGETMKYLYRYGAGTVGFVSSFLYGGGGLAAGGTFVKGAAMLPKAGAIGGGMIKLGQGLQKLTQKAKLINTTKAGLQAARAGGNAKAAIVLGNTVNAALDGIVAGVLADFTLYRPEENEGHLADAWGETDNPLISFLQTKETDSTFEARLKNVVDGVLIGIPFGAALGGSVASIALKPTVRKFAKGLNKTLHAKTAEEAGEALIETAQAKISMDNLATTLDTVNIVDDLRKEAQETGEEVSQLIADRLPNSKIEEAQAIAKLREAGENIFPYEDGTWSIKVEKWEDAYKVTPEQYQSQLKAQDPSGNLGVSHMNSAVEATWQQRGLINGNGLLGSSKERTTTTNTIVDYYKDKWELEKKLPKEKNKKITVKYGDWSNIPDGKTTQYKNGNVLIQINNNSQDIYATLRSELEHARDFVKGEVPDQNLQHFSRYGGLNEAEVAPSYVYKKSKGKAQLKATDTAISNTKNDVNNLMENEYNTPKGGIDETGNISEYGSRDAQGIREETSTNDRSSSVNNSKEQPLSERDGNLVQGDSRVDSRRTASDSNISPTQLNLTPNATPDDIGANIAKGDIKLSEEGSIDAVINQIAKTDIDISGKTFKDVAADADSYFNQALKENPQKAAAYFNAQSPEILDGIVRQQLAATKLLSVLKDVQANANPRENLRILTAVKDIEKYIEGVGSGFGRGLRYQSITKKAVNTFGSERFSDLAMQGINDIADILDSISLNFTRAQSLQAFKSEFLTNFQKHPSYNEIVGDRQMFSKLNDVLEETYGNLKAGKKVNSAETIMEAMVRDEAETCGWYAKLADTTDGFVKTIKHWGNQAPSYVINNVLGIASAFKNISSGAIQTNLYPTYKVLGGFLTGNGEVTREGIDQWLGTFVNFGEAMRLAKQAFINGDGLLTNSKEIVEGSLQNGFHKWATSFKEIGDDGFGITLQNMHSFIPRVMMSSDEFMTQLNYRNIVRAKALSQARREAGLIGDAAQTADEIFNKTAFTEDGKPLDFKAFVEAKDMLFQIPLSRKIYDPAAGTTRETGMDKTLVSGIGDWLQAGTQKFIPLRLFMPFIKTPTNIADQALQANPLYAVLNNNTRKQFFSTDPETRAKAYGKMATMLTLGAGFTLAAANGQITGSAPMDKKEKTALLKTGWRPYSVKIGDKWIPYMGMVTPLDSYMAFCADSVALTGRALSGEQEAGLGEIAGQILGNIMNDYIDQAGFRTNTAKLMDIFNPSTDVRVREQLAANTLSSFLPMSGNVNAIRSAVKTVKGDTEQKKPEGFYENLVRNYTDIFTGPQDYRRDVFGNRVDQYGLIIAKATDDKFMQPEYTEMARMAEKGYSPSNIAHLLKKTGVPLEEFKSQETGRSAYDAMYDELTEVKIGGKTLQESVAELIQTPRYQSLNDGINADGKDWSAVSYKTKKKLLDDTFQRYYTVAKRKVINKRGDEFVDKKGLTMKQRQQQVRLQMLNEKVKQDLDQNLIHQITKF